ncbi:sugar ABC transporter permease [Fredinandcohnia sp. QZ13]|uniref:carbohydrate ABC transporter permease n=1 Tax=Fredinandcohnia sp. QZ13 TaxID=3073144 RepID=UPI0028533389|nr:sugar ABC transporter permease [Fredinandcohnia sp. QZ13]MDR4888108.1 sugar ABC transporter permease [Fredinandcohnia sp. QZ13]
MLVNYKETKVTSLAPPKKVFWNEKRKESLAGLLFVLPEFLGICLMGVFPLFFTLFLAFTEWNFIGGIEAINFVGLENFKKLMSDESFHLALKNNLLYTLFTVPVGMVLALILAVVIHSKVYAKDFFKVAFFIPYISTQVAVAAIWAALFHPSLGPINQFLLNIGITDPPKWLGSTDSVMAAIIIIGIWHTVGYIVIIYISGLSTISEDVYEAAEIDGANFFQKFIRITVPLLSPTTFFLAITLMISSFKVFDLIAFLTQGGPNHSSNVLVYYIYEEGFQNFRMGYASAISWVLFVIVAVLTIVMWKIQNRKAD